MAIQPGQATPTLARSRRSEPKWWDTAHNAVRVVASRSGLPGGGLLRSPEFASVQPSEKESGPRQK